MFCRKCGKAIPDDSNFCPYCGETISLEISDSSKSKTGFCSICGGPLPSGKLSGICDSCIEQIGYDPYEYGTCKKCGRPLGKDDKENLCKTCLADNKNCSNFLMNQPKEKMSDKFSLRLMKKHIRWFEENGLTVTKRIGSLLVDENKHKWAIAVIGSSNQRIHDFSDIASVEITENGEKYKSQHGIMRAVAGGAIFGAVGALVGAGTAKRAKTIRHLSVDILLNDLSCPIESIVMIRDATKTDSYLYQKAYENVKQMAAALMVMQRIAGNETAG